MQTKLKARSERRMTQFLLAFSSHIAINETYPNNSLLYSKKEKKNSHMA